MLELAPIFKIIIDEENTHRNELITYVFSKNYLGKTLKSIKESMYSDKEFEII